MMFKHNKQKIKELKIIINTINCIVSDKNSISVRYIVTKIIEKS